LVLFHNQFTKLQENAQVILLIILNYLQILGVVIPMRRDGNTTITRYSGGSGVIFQVT